MSQTRRAFLRTATVSALAWPLVVQSQSRDASQSAVFRHGVASGDPATDGIILWTRVSPDNGPDEIDVRWVISASPFLEPTVGTGVVRTSAERDFTVKVDVGGLDPGTNYYYTFEALNERSPIGRTRTLPVGPVGRTRIAQVCCANYPAGYFNVYRILANRNDIDVVVHLGDYIYEYEDGVLGFGERLDRVPSPNKELVALGDYRSRYAQYRSDPDLQAVHRQHPFVVVWDDHELANNAWRGGAANHGVNEGAWATRRAAARRAYLEWMPIREAPGSDTRLYRQFRFGDLCDLLMLDARSYRDEQVAGLDVEGLSAPRRTMMGAQQESWLHQNLQASVAAGMHWRILGQQVMFSPLTPDPGPTINGDTWDGYRAERARLLDLISTAPVPDVAILSGDFHSSWAFDVPRNPWRGYAPSSGTGSLAVEFLAPAVSSPPLFSDPALRAQSALLRANVPHLRFLEGERRGYVVVDVTPDRVLAEWRLVPDVAIRSDEEVRAMGLVCERGAARLAVDTSALPPHTPGDPFS